MGQLFAGRIATFVGQTVDGVKKKSFWLLIALWIMEVLRWLPMGIFYVAIGYLYQLEYIITNEYMWIQLILMFISTGFLYLMGMNMIKNPNRAFLLGNTIAFCISTFLGSVYCLIHTIWGGIESKVNWDGFIDTNEEKGMQVTFLILSGICAIIGVLEAIFAYYVYYYMYQAEGFYNEKGLLEEAKEKLQRTGGKIYMMRDTSYGMYTAVMVILALQVAFLLYFYIATSFLPVLFITTINDFNWIYMFLLVGGNLVWVLGFFFLTRGQSSFHDIIAMLLIGLMFLEEIWMLVYFIWGMVVLIKDPDTYSNESAYRIMISFLVLSGLNALVVIPIKAVALVASTRARNTLLDLIGYDKSEKVEDSNIELDEMDMAI